MSADDEQVTQGLQRMAMESLNDKASVEISHAYHVTSEEVIFDENGSPCNRPNWKMLRWHLADDPTFDGEKLLGAPCVFFTTTLRGMKYPKQTMYPRGGKKGAFYWRVRVPLTYFNDHKILYIQKHGPQVRLLLLRNEHAQGITRDKLKELSADKYLRREIINQADAMNYPDVKYYSNDYDVKGTGYFVNFAVCEDVDLTTGGVFWDCVEHTMNKPGFPDRDALRDRLLGAIVQSL